MTVEFALKLPVYGQDEDADFDHCITAAQAGEAAGFSSAYVIDHLRLPSKRLLGKTTSDPDKPYFIDAWCTLAAVAASTRTIRIGPQVTPIGLRHPVFVAKWGATVDRISHGRLRLGVGCGHQAVEYISHGLPFPNFSARYKGMLEGVEIIRLLWTEDQPITFKGEIYYIENVSFWPKPIQREIPIWFGGASPSIRNAVAATGDGWFPAAPQHGGFGAQGAAIFDKQLSEIREAAKNEGRHAHIGSGAVFMVTISNRDEDIERAANLIRRRPGQENHSVDELNSRGEFILGKPDDVTRMLEPYAVAGVEEFTISFHPLDDMDGMRRGIDLFAEKVAPRFQ